MPSVISNKTPKTTWPTSSCTERTGKLTGPRMTAEEFDRIALSHGAREVTAAESLVYREALRDLDAVAAA